MLYSASALTLHDSRNLLSKPFTEILTRFFTLETSYRDSKKPLFHLTDSSSSRNRNTKLILPAKSTCKNMKMFERYTHKSNMRLPEYLETLLHRNDSETSSRFYNHRIESTIIQELGELLGTHTQIGRALSCLSRNFPASKQLLELASQHQGRLYSN